MHIAGKISDNFFKNNQNWQGTVTHTYNPSTQEAEAGGLWVERQPDLFSETLS
jgi:hypothetical protein